MAKPVFATLDVPTAAQFNSWLVNTNFARKSATASISSNITLQPDSELFFAVEANAIYVVEAMIQYDGAAGNADLKMLFRTPSGGSFAGSATVISTSGATAFDLAQIAIPGNGSFDMGTLGSGTQSFKVNGMLITAGSAGNLSIEWCQNTSNATATRVLAGSYITGRRVS